MADSKKMPSRSGLQDDHDTTSMRRKHIWQQNATQLYLVSSRGVQHLPENLASVASEFHIAHNCEHWPNNETKYRDERKPGKVGTSTDTMWHANPDNTPSGAMVISVSSGNMNLAHSKPKLRHSKW